jgi:hypothetical protein
MIVTGAPPVRLLTGVLATALGILAFFVLIGVFGFGAAVAGLLIVWSLAVAVGVVRQGGDSR